MSIPRNNKTKTLTRGGESLASKMRTLTAMPSIFEGKTEKEIKELKCHVELIMAKAKIKINAQFYNMDEAFVDGHLATAKMLELEGFTVEYFDHAKQMLVSWKN